MWEFFKPLSYTMGAGGPDDTWWPNDGVVNTESEVHPPNCYTYWCQRSKVRQKRSTDRAASRTVRL